jgi:hypothetical protein
VTGRPRRLAGRPVGERARKAFLEALAAGSTVVEASEAAGRPKQTFYRLRDSDPEFAAEWRQAWWAGAEPIENVLHRAALEGWDDEEYDGAGKLVRRMRRWTPNAAVAALRARRPELYRESAKVEVSSTVGVAVVKHEMGLTMGEIARSAVEQVRLGNSSQVPAALLPYVQELEREEQQRELLPGADEPKTSEGDER